jgi:hypothetical protein
MKRKIVLACIILSGLFFTPALADLSLIQPMGEGARAFGMGNNYVALSGDLSAMFWNPAGFAFVPAREFQLSFDGLSQKTTSTFLGSNATNTVTRPRLENIGYMHAFPTVQGGFTIAASYHSTYLLDDALSTSGGYTGIGGESVLLNEQYKTYGALDMWSVGFGLQVAKGLGIGAAVSLVTGREDGSNNGQNYTNGVIADPANDYYDETVGVNYFGYDIRLGILYSFLQRYRVGLRLVLPQSIGFDQNVKDIFQYSPQSNYTFDTTGKLFSSFSCALGGAAEFRFLTVSAEVRARAPYSIMNPSYDIPDTSLASKTMFGAGLGVEVPLGVSWILLRGGFSWDQFDTHLFVKQYKDDDKPVWDPQGLAPVGDRLQGTVGMGFIIKNVMLEWAYGYDTWKLETKTSLGPLDETHVQQRILASMSVHF